MGEILKAYCKKSNYYEDGSSSVTEGNEYIVVAEYTDTKGIMHCVIIDDQRNENHFYYDNEFLEFKEL